MNHGVTVTVIKYILTSIENQNVKIKIRRNFHKGSYKDTRKYLVPLKKNKENGIKRNICQKKWLEK